MAEPTPPVVPADTTDWAATPAQPEPTLTDILHEQQAHRAEVSALRSELAASKNQAAAPVQSANPPSAEEALAARLAEIEEYPFYCPSCGALYHTERECIGLNGAYPHPVTPVVSTDELKQDDTTKHTAAPAVVV